MIIQNSRQKINNKELSDLESKLNITFPNDFKEFLLQNNGGIPNPNVFDFINRDGYNANSFVHYFYAVYDGNDYDSLESNYLLYSSEKRLPSNIIPIAGDAFGNLICISISGDDYGKIYFWDHELEGQSESYDNMSLIKNNFNEFISNLHEFKT